MGPLTIDKFYVYHHFNEPLVMGAEWYVVECCDEVAEWLLAEHNAATYHIKQKHYPGEYPPGYKGKKYLIINPDIYVMLCLKYGKESR